MPAKKTASTRDQQADALVDTLKALAHSRRIGILLHLREGPRVVSEIIANTALKSSNCSHQLSILRARGLVVANRVEQGKQYSLTPEGAKVLGLIEQITIRLA